MHFVESDNREVSNVTYNCCFLPENASDDRIADQKGFQ